MVEEAHADCDGVGQTHTDHGAHATQASSLFMNMHSSVISFQRPSPSCGVCALSIGFYFDDGKEHFIRNQQMYDSSSIALLLLECCVTM